MVDGKLRVLAFGAHPDDCDFCAGGTAALLARGGHSVWFVSLTNGDAGHHLMGGATLAKRRRAEAHAAAAVIGIDYVVLDHHDGELLPTLENRREIIGLIRAFRPDLILSPRPSDYHPDHRYTAQLVQDAAYMVTVPNVGAFDPHLMTNPAILYVSDRFQKPYPFKADVVVAIDETVEAKRAMLQCHASQYYEWLPYNGGYLEEVPDGEPARRTWLAAHLEPGLRHDADRYRARLVELYGAEVGERVRYAEAFEISEYGASLTPADLRTLFPFIPADSIG
jgi:LmbE family N-acetylglucosaminyl deacetylase